jgi:hypothetical protein
MKLNTTLTGKQARYVPLLEDKALCLILISDPTCPKKLNNE